MSTAPAQLPGLDRGREPPYPTRDGRPMGETDIHIDQTFDAREALKMFFKGQRVYVSGNILLFYEQGNRRKHVSPDVLVTRGIEPRQRDNYLLWEERKAPDVVIEVTSKSTKDEDRDEKFEIYRDRVKVKEYFLFDPRSEYLKPPLQGYRLVRGRYVEIKPVAGRLPSKELGLHLEKRGEVLCFIDPETRTRLLTPRDAHDREQERADAEKQRADATEGRALAAERELEAERQRAAVAERQIEEERARAAAEIARLRRELEGRLRKETDAT